MVGNGPREPVDMPEGATVFDYIKAGGLLLLIALGLGAFVLWELFR